MEEQAHPRITPYLYYPSATEALAFLVDAFGFEEVSALRDKAAGATIVSDPAEHPGGHRQYIAADCGGQQWIFAQPSAERVRP